MQTRDFSLDEMTLQSHEVLMTGKVCFLQLHMNVKEIFLPGKSGV